MYMGVVFGMSEAKITPRLVVLPVEQASSFGRVLGTVGSRSHIHVVNVYRCCLQSEPNEDNP